MQASLGHPRRPYQAPLVRRCQGLGKKELRYARNEAIIYTSWNDDIVISGPERTQNLGSAAETFQDSPQWTRLVLCLKGSIDSLGVDSIFTCVYFGGGGRHCVL